MQRKVVYLNKVTKDGSNIYNQCPECEGEGVELGDYEQGMSELQVWPCDLCEGTGRAEEDIDYKLIVHMIEGQEYVSFNKISKGDNNAKR